jgi:hypothetical protein
MTMSFGNDASFDGSNITRFGAEGQPNAHLAQRIAHRIDRVAHLVRPDGASLPMP